MKRVVTMFALLWATTAVYAQQMNHTAAISTTDASKAVISEKYVAVNQALRKLWSDHMHWTLATVDAFYNEPKQLEWKLNRLLENQKEIGASIVPFYGQAAGDQLTKLLTEHIQQAVPVLTAAKANDKVALDKALADWYRNANDIATFLSSANPNWPKSVTEPHVNMHITQTTGYAVNVLKGEYGPSIKAFEEALHHMLMLADVLTEGLAKQFPDKF